QAVEDEAKQKPRFLLCVLREVQDGLIQSFPNACWKLLWDGYRLRLTPRAAAAQSPSASC
ncbi:MAG: hypothetical protein ACT4NU_13100, partial [Chromatiales bacterium]